MFVVALVSMNQSWEAGCCSFIVLNALMRPKESHDGPGEPGCMAGGKARVGATTN